MRANVYPSASRPRALRRERAGQLFLLTGVILTLTLLMLSNLTVSRIALGGNETAGEDLLDVRANVMAAFEDALQLRAGAVRDATGLVTQGDIRNAIEELDADIGALMAQRGYAFHASYLSATKSKVDVFSVEYRMTIQDRDAVWEGTGSCEIAA